MSTYNGRNARVTVNAPDAEALITEMGTWEVDLSAGSIDTGAFGDGWDKSDAGMKGYKGTLTGFCDPKDLTGQQVLEEAFESGDLLGKIRFYIKFGKKSGQDHLYLAPDLTADPNAGIRIIGYKFKQDKAGVGTINISFTGSGPIKMNRETIT